MRIFTTTNDGWKKVPVLWASAERAYQIKHNKELRDSRGVLKLPLITVERTAISKSLTRKGALYANVPEDGTAGGVITIGRRIKQDKTANFQNADAKHKRGQINFPRKSKKVVYETLSIPLPKYIDLTYEVTIQTEYQQQMNEILTPFLTRTGSINYFTLRKDGHLYEGFIEEDIAQDNNSSDLGEDERTYKSTITIKVLGHIVGDENNQEKPKVVVRENAVHVRIPREHVLLEDEHPDDWKGGFYRE